MFGQCGAVPVADAVDGETERGGLPRVVGNLEKIVRDPADEADARIGIDDAVDVHPSVMLVGKIVDGSEWLRGALLPIG